MPRTSLPPRIAAGRGKGARWREAAGRSLAADGRDAAGVPISPVLVQSLFRSFRLNADGELAGAVAGRLYGTGVGARRASFQSFNPSGGRMASNRTPASVAMCSRRAA